ncbi:MAG: outer membrane protein assembly factor BamB family protein, partial [Planctomycetota bacterium]
APSREALETVPQARAAAAGEKAGPAFPSAEEVEREWPRFRGPRGDGVSRYADVPDSFDAATGRGIVWKVPVPLPGHGSPVVWGERVFLSGADERREEVFSFDARSGALLWREPLAGEPGRKPPEVLEATGFAASTPATDGRRVYAIFATGDLAAFEASGKKLWERKLGPLDNSYGYGTSLVLEGPLLYVLLDEGAEGEGKSRLLALRALSGETAWEAKRPVAASWATPIIIPAPRGRQLVTSANPVVLSYDPETGRELWKAECMAGDVAPSPIFAGGLVFAVNVDAELCAIRPDGEGDVTETHIAWRGEDGLPDIASPASDGSLVFVVAPNGRLTCYDAAEGDVVWEERLKVPCHASPSVVGDRLHLWAKRGTLIVVKIARTFQELARSELGEEVHASPAFAPGRIYVRGAAHLWCLGKP